jgi:hypothetical protein
VALRSDEPRYFDNATCGVDWRNVGDRDAARRRGGRRGRRANNHSAAASGALREERPFLNQIVNASVRTRAKQSVTITQNQAR